MARVSSLIYAGEAHRALLEAVVDPPYLVVTSRDELFAAIEKHHPDVAFIDVDLLPALAEQMSGVPVVAVMDASLELIVRALHKHPWLSHLVGTGVLQTELAKPSVDMVCRRLASKGLSQRSGTGRIALLKSSHRREARLSRLREYFVARNVSQKMTAAMSDVAEELLTNALYNAPVEAGFCDAPTERTVDVELPAPQACEISYGLEDDGVFVRVRDPFGALTRDRMLGVLERCNHQAVALDETRGGAGLGLWRVFSLASTISITVIPGRLTDITVRVEAKKTRAARKQLHSVQLFFCERPADLSPSRFAADHDSDLIDDSFTALSL